MSILQQILQSEQKASQYKASALEDRKQLLEETRKKAKLETDQLIEEAHQKALTITEEKEASLLALDEAFNQEIQTLKEALLKDIDKKQDEAFKFLLEVML